MNLEVALHSNIPFSASKNSTFLCSVVIKLYDAYPTYTSGT